LLYLLKLPNHDFMVRARKRCGLLLLGIRKEVVEELCKEPEGDREAAIKAVRVRRRGRGGNWKGSTDLGMALELYSS